MKRRRFIKLLGFAVALSGGLWPLAARAQQTEKPVIGFLHGGASGSFAQHVAAFRRGIGEIGYVEGQNVIVEYRWAERQNDRLPALVADLVSRRVAVIATGGGSRAALAAKAATTTIPIVFTTGVDPVEVGLVPSIGRPSGNITGINFFASILGGKQLELMREMAPKATSVGVLMNPSNPNTRRYMNDVQAAARALQIDVKLLTVHTPPDIDAAVATLLPRGASALLVGGDALLNSERDRIVALAAGHAFPAIYLQREYVDAGGLMSYGSSQTDAYRLAGVYAGRILKGEKAVDLPVLQPTTFELVINLKTARTLGLTVPLTLQAAANDVIE